MRNWLIFLATLIFCMPSNAAALPDPMATTAARKWSPMEGSPPVTLASIQGRQALRMDCKFAGTRFERASWDYQGAIDLSAIQTIRFSVLCTNATPVSSFVVYFGSGEGWYTTTFPVETEGKWNGVEVRKEDTRIEGTPAGWSKVDRIRISAWRGMDVDTTLYLAGFVAAGEQPSVLVVRGDSLATLAPSEVQSANQFAQTTVTLMREAGIDCAVISDVDCTAETLRSAKLVVLPHNPKLPDPALKALTAYLGSGGKLMSFYQLPEPLLATCALVAVAYHQQSRPGEFSSIRPDNPSLPGMPAEVKQNSWNVMDYRAAEGRGRTVASWYDADGKPTGVAALVLTDRALCMTHVLQSGDAPAKRQMVLAMVGALVPDVWRKAATRQYDSVGKLASYTDYQQAATALSAAGDAPKAAVGRATQLRDQSQAMLQGSKFAEAMPLAQAAQRELLDAYCLAQQPMPGEHRAFWCHRAFGVDGMTWDQAIKELADNGFTAIFPNMLWGGSAFYQSDVLPVAPEVATRGDQIAQCLAACRKYGVQCHVWKVNWNMGWSAPQQFMQKMKQEARTQVNFDGKAEDRWLCPSNPLNQDLEIAAMVEVATKYDVDGIHFDYIRYPGPENCFCNGCKERFQKQIGKVVADWPRAVRSDTQLAAAWQDFRRSNITRVVAEVSQKVRASGKKTKISAAVFPNYAVDRDSVGQDWKLWCDRGYLDFVCPMDYTASLGEFRHLVTRQIQWAGKVPVYPGIGLSVWPGGGRDVVKLTEMIKTTRELGCKGFTVFEYNTAEAQDVLPSLGKGITHK